VDHQIGSKLNLMGSLLYDNGRQTQSPPLWAGGPVVLSVVKVLSLPYLVPPLFVATIRKWYVVLAVKPLMFALTLWYVFPVFVWEAVVDP
jgi:hypothetical protein